MSHESHIYIFSLFQDDASFGRYKFFNCTIGRIIRLATNNVNEKDDEACERESEVAGMHCNRMTVENGGIGINLGNVVMNGKDFPHNDGISVNLGHADMNGKKLPNNIQNCDIDEIVLKPRQ